MRALRCADITQEEKKSPEMISIYQIEISFMEPYNLLYGVGPGRII